MNSPLLPEVRAVEPVSFAPGYPAGMLVGLADGRIVVLLEDGNAFRLTRLGTAACWVRLDPSRTNWMAADEAGNLLVARPHGRLRLAWDRRIVQATLLSDSHCIGIDAGARVVAWDPHESTGRRLNDPQGQPLTAHELAVRDDDGSLVLRRGLAWTRRSPGDGGTGETFAPVDGMDLRQQNGDIGLTRNGRHFYLYWDDLQVFDTARGELVREAPADWYVHATSLSDDGQRLAMGGKAGWLGVAGPDGDLVAELRPARTDLTAAIIGADGVAVAWMDREGKAGLVDVARSRELLSASAVAALLAGLDDPAPDRGAAPEPFGDPEPSP